MYWSWRRRQRTNSQSAAIQFTVGEKRASVCAPGTVVSRSGWTVAVKTRIDRSGLSRQQAISTVRHTRIAGTRVMSLHAQGKAVDVRGPYGCIYGQLKDWTGGYSTDAGRMSHIHISYDDAGGREMGLRFAHGGGRRHSWRNSYARMR